MQYWQHVEHWISIWPSRYRRSLATLTWFYVSKEVHNLRRWADCERRDNGWLSSTVTILAFGFLKVMEATVLSLKVSAWYCWEEEHDDHRLCSLALLEGCSGWTDWATNCQEASIMRRVLWCRVVKFRSSRSWRWSWNRDRHPSHESSCVWYITIIILSCLHNQ